MNILVFFGGMSVEHDISVITGIQALNALKAEKNAVFKFENKKIKSETADYNFFPVYIDKSGKWWGGEKLKDINFIKNFSGKDVFEVTLNLSSPQLLKKRFGKFVKYLEADGAVLCNHGHGGEDGCLQGALELSGIPYTSSNVLGSAVCMDKIIMKDVLKANDFPVVESVWVSKKEWTNNKDNCMKKFSDDIGFPAVVKPASLGSSIGISICKNKKDLEEAVEVAFGFDNRILVESAVENLREFNCSVLGTTDSCIASDIEEPINWESFLSFDAKYLSNGKTSGMGSSKRIFPAEIKKELSDKIKELSLKAFKIFSCKGIVRIDFLFNEKTEELFLNEINTIPGSLSNYFWKKEGYSYTKLIIKLLEIAKKEKQKNANLITTYSSKALENFSDKGLKKN